MGKTKMSGDSSENNDLGVRKHQIRGKKVRQKWNHIFKRIYVRNGMQQQHKSNKHEFVSDDNNQENVEKPVESPEKVSVECEKPTKMNGSRIITDPIPSTSTGITANGRGKRKWEEIQQNMMMKRRYLGRINGISAHIDSDSSLDDSDYETRGMMNGEFDLSSDVHYEDSDEGSDYNDIADLMAMHEMENNGLGSDYDEYGEFCSEEESLEEEYSHEEDESYDSNEIESEYFSEDSAEMDEDYTEDDDDEENYHLYEGSSSDTDYDPGSDFMEDLYVARGTAVVYSATNDITSQLPFTEDSNEPQVIDVTDLLDTKSTDSGDSCPKLVPIGTKINGKVSPNSISETSASSDELPTPNNSSILIDDELTSSESANSVLSINDSSSESEKDTNFTCTNTKDDFFLSNSLNNNSPSCLLHLKKPIFVNGVIDVELLAGNASIFGYNLKKGQKTAQIVSARGYKHINIMPRPSLEEINPENLQILMKNLRNQFSHEDLDQISSTFDLESHALLLLTRSKVNSRVKMIQKYTSNRYLFPNSMTIGQKHPHFMSESILNTKIYTHATCKRPLKIQPEWDSIPVDARTIVIGGKNVGKSTCIEYLINKKLSESKNTRNCVLLIDLDIGQPILHVPQVISAILVETPILGPGALTSEGKTILKSFMFGDVSVMLSPVKYMRCVKKLFEFCEKLSTSTLKDVPWIINTMGFQKGLGVEIMCGVIKVAHPSTLVQIQHEIENFNFRNVMTDDFVNNFTFNMFKEEIEDCPNTKLNKRVTYNLIELCSVMNNNELVAEGSQNGKSKEEPGLLPAEKRTVMMLAHLADVQSDCEWITDAVPYVVSNPLISIASTEKIPKNRELEAINGNIIYLCHCPTTDVSNTEIYECFGIGLVRAIDIKNNLSYVHHSIPREKMHEVNMLVLANITPPKDIFLKQSTKIKGTLPNLYNTDSEFAGSKKISRGNNSQYLNNN